MGKRELKFGINTITGMQLSLVARGWYWTSWAALLIAVWAALFAEILIRLPDGIGNYVVEAAIGICAPMLGLLIADHLTVEHYLHTWRLLKDKQHASILLEPKHIERVRFELRHNWLLRWVRPAKSPTIGAQLFAAALWWQAVVAPEGTGWLKRYWEPLGMALGLLFAALVPTILFFAATALDVMLTMPLLATALACAAVSLGLLAVSLLRTTARWQSIVDYFAAWREDSNVKGIT